MADSVEILTVDVGRVFTSVLNSRSKQSAVFGVLENHVTQNQIYWTTVNH